MMGVYIKGVKMPKSCLECDLYNDDNNFCKAQKEYMPFTSFGRDYKDADCPLVEVSVPHGRLIDEGEITAFLELERNDENVESLDEFPTVIEAE